MDRNLYLLSPDEIKMIQDINTMGERSPLFLFNQQFCFKSVKDTSDCLPVDLVILTKGNVSTSVSSSQDGNGYEPIIDDIEAEEETIRKIIGEEIDHRNGQNRNGDYQNEENLFEPEPIPELPNYYSNNRDEPIFVDWDDDPTLENGPYDDTPYEDWYKTREYGHNVTLETLMTNYGVMAAPGRLNNCELLQLDARLGHLSWCKKRLSSTTKWSGSILGKYMVRFDNSYKPISRTIYLLIDNIQQLATNKGTTRDTFIAETYIHEMFHAYYDNIRTTNIVNAYLQGITEIEEAMAEFGMLVFLSKFNSSFLPYAHANVMSKLTSGDPYLQFYGLGAELFNKWATINPFNGKILEKYQKIMPSPRYGIRLVDYFVRLARSRRHFNANNCIKSIHDIIDWFDSNIGNSQQHYKYGGYTTGCSNRMVLAVLSDYAKQPTSNLIHMQTLFNNFSPSYGKYHIFEERSAIKDDIANHYMLDKPVTLSDGSVIVVAGRWNNSPKGNTAAFLTQVKRLKRRRVLMNCVELLR